MLKWTDVHKTRRGAAGRARQSLPPQCVLARGTHLADALSCGQRAGVLFPSVSPADITLLLRTHIRVPPEYSLSAHGIRAGTDLMLQALQVPDDLIAAWGWWARVRRMTGYYGALSISLCLAISDLFPEVRISPIAPGWYAPVAIPVIPKWSALRTLGEPLPDAPTSNIRSADGADAAEESDPEERPACQHSPAAEGAMAAAMPPPKARTRTR
jgi:hypothetical protein